MGRARRPTVDCFSQNLRETHTNLAKCSGGPYIAAGGGCCAEGAVFAPLAHFTGSAAKAPIS
eukprot:3111683-Prymnesium_polylepis.1